jgi:serine/threonine protein kinase
MSAPGPTITVSIDGCNVTFALKTERDDPMVWMRAIQDAVQWCSEAQEQECKFDLDACSTSFLEWRKTRAENAIAFDDRYRIGGMLGQGSSAAVYLCTQRVTGETCAVKRMQWEEDAGASAKYAQEVHEEARILMTLSHPNIIRVMDFYEAPGRTWLVEEVCTGGELLDCITAREKVQCERCYLHAIMRTLARCTVLNSILDHLYAVNAPMHSHTQQQTLPTSQVFEEADAKRVMRQVLDALSYLHSKGIAHRDLKPGNLVYKNREQTSLRIVDFGFACDTHARKHSATGGARQHRMRRMETNIG